MSTLQGKSISQTYQRLLQTPTEVTDTNLKPIQTGKGQSTSMSISTDKVEFLKVGIGTGGVEPDGLLHVLSVTAGAVTASSSANQLVLENSSDSGLSILSGASSLGNIFFGDVNDNDVGKITYDHSENSLKFTTSGAETMKLDSSGNLNIGGILSQSEDRYELVEFFHQLPAIDVSNATYTQGSADSTVDGTAKNSKISKITFVAHNFNSDAENRCTFTNNKIHANSFVHAYIIDATNDVAINASDINLNVINVGDGTCTIVAKHTGTTSTTTSVLTVIVVIDPHLIVNQNFQLLGTNVSEALVVYGGTQPGIRFVTAGADNDQAIIRERRSTESNGTNLNDLNPFTNVNYTTDDEVEFNGSISTGSSISNLGFAVGLSGGGFPSDLTDQDHKAYFLYATNDDLGTLTTNANLHFVYSVGGVDYVTDLGIVVAVSTVYRLKIRIDSNRQISVFVNNERKGLSRTSTATTAGGLTQSDSNVKSLALTTGQNLLPFAGLQALSASAVLLHLHFIKLSRKLA
jgi:hypothetical protein